MPDLLLRNVRIVPLSPRANAPAGVVDVLVAGGVVSAVGEGLSRPGGVEAYDAGGRWLVPGLWDAHTHLGQWTLRASRLDLHGTRSPAEALARVAAAARALEGQNEPGEAIVGMGHSAGTWDRWGTVSELDSVTGGTPAILVNHDFHHAWLNTAALDAVELPRREDMVQETEWYQAYPRVAELFESNGSTPAAYRRMLSRTAALGVVGMTDFEVGVRVDDWRSRWTSGCDLVRIRVASYADQLDEAIAEGLRTGDPLLAGEDRLTMGPLKIISDGSLGTRTAWCCDPYADDPDSCGAPNQSPDELRGLLDKAHAAGLEVATHAIGDRAVSEALVAYAATGARGSIEHAQLVRREDLPLMARLGITASVQPAHILDDREMTEGVWPGREDRCFATRWMLDEGVRVTLGSDAPVAPLDPWLAISAAVGRSRDGKEPWHPEQALTVQEALAASVDGQPTVGPGSRGDLAVLDIDPLRASVGDLAAIAHGGVVLTTVGGRVVHRSV
jgi:predicted amidohydrolase YtcJ